jgi:YVTN family beta-propeller protein
MDGAMVNALKPLCAVLLPIVVGCSSDGHGDAHTSSPTDAPTTVPVSAIDFDALFVVNGGDNSISVVDIEAGSVAGTIMLKNASFPHHLYLSSDGSRMLLAAPGMDLSGGHSGGHAGHAMRGAVLLLDGSTGATIKSRHLEAMNHNAAFGPGGEVWTSQMMSPGTVLVLAAANLETTATVAVGDGPAEVTFSADGRRAFVANGASDTVTVIDSASRSVVKTIAVGDNPVGAWQGSNGIAYVDNEAAKTLDAVDVETLEISHSYNLGFTPGMAAYGPDGAVWVSDADGGKIVRFGATADQRLSEIATAAGAHAIAFSGDGVTAFVSNQSANSVSVIDVATFTTKATIAVGAKPNGMVWRQFQSN